MPWLRRTQRRSREKTVFSFFGGSFTFFRFGAFLAFLITSSSLLFLARRNGKAMMDLDLESGEFRQNVLPFGHKQKSGALGA